MSYDGVSVDNVCKTDTVSEKGNISDGSVSDKVKDASSKRRVLVVDDEKRMRNMCYEMLETAGYKVITAEDGREGYDKVKKAIEEGRPYHAIVSDIQMPNLSGPEMIRLLKNTNVDGNTPVIFISGYHQPEELIGENLSPYAVLKKPVMMMPLLECVAGAVEKGKELYKC